VSKQPLAIRWRIALRDDDRPSRSAKLLGLMLSTYTDNGTGSTFAGLPTLARSCGFSIDTARRAYHELRRLKYLDVSPRPGLTSITTLRLPLAPMQGVPLARAPVTPSTHATRSLKISNGGAPGGSAPPISLSECAGCGEVLPLVIRDLYCSEGCVQ
jgi:hypothetical protein